MGKRAREAVSARYDIGRTADAWLEPIRRSWPTTMTPTRSGTTVTIGLVALREQYEQLKPKIDAAIASVIQRSAFIAGSDVGEFERWFRDFCGVRHALGVSSGTTALELVLRALKVAAGDEVIIPANTFVATGASVVAAGAKPVLVDADPDRETSIRLASPR